MFGISSFSSAPFASLYYAKTVYALSISENFTLSDSNTTSGAFLQSLTENVSFADSQSGSVTFLSSITENFNPQDSTSTQSTFNNSIVENFSLSDSNNSGGWVRVNDSNTMTWILINNTQ